MSKPEFNKMSGVEAEKYIRDTFWPDCFMHIHGPECTIISHTFKIIDEIRKTNSDFKYICGPTRLIGYEWPREKQIEAEDNLWKITAAWCYESMLSGKITKLDKN